jgi:hypothetical protein
MARSGFRLRQKKYGLFVYSSGLSFALQGGGINDKTWDIRRGHTRGTPEETRRDTKRQKETRQDKTRQDKTRQDKNTTRQEHDKTEHDTRQDKTRHDTTRQDQTRQDKTRQENEDLYFLRRILQFPGFWIPVCACREGSFCLRMNQTHCLAHSDALAAHVSRRGEASKMESYIG